MWRGISNAPAFSALCVIISLPDVTQAGDVCQLAKLTASDATEHVLFGNAVSISGHVAVIGAWGDPGAGGSSGAAYVYRFDGTRWNEEAKLTASDGSPPYFFGRSVAVDNNVAVIGASSPYSGRPSFGYANVYRFDGTTWIKEAKLAPSDARAQAEFGVSVSVSGDVVLVGAYRDDDASDDSCAASLAEYAEFQTCFATDQKMSSRCELLDLDQDKDIDLDDYNHFLHLGCDHGSAYVYRFDGANWVEGAKITATDSAPGDSFGETVSISGHVAVIGALQDDYGGRTHGSAYVYRLDGGTWIEEAKLTPPASDTAYFFGRPVCVSGDVALVGARGGTTGAAYVFRFEAGDWIRESRLLPSDFINSYNFGTAVSIDGNIAVIGATGDREGGYYTGAAYVYGFDGAVWQERAKLKAADAGIGDTFGTSAAVSGDMVLIGALYDDDGAEKSGSAYVFSLNGECNP